MNKEELMGFVEKIERREKLVRDINDIEHKLDQPWYHDENPAKDPVTLYKGLLKSLQEELTAFDNQLMNEYEYHPIKKEMDGPKSTPIEKMVEEADWNEEKKINSIKKSFETFFID